MPEQLPRQDLRADCGACTALCCVAPRFAVSADFPIDKPAGRACPNLNADYRCRIHDRLHQAGFAGCATFDCFGAGQRTTGAFGERNWRTDPGVAERMFQVFGVLRLLHEMLWYLEEACDRLPAGDLQQTAGQKRRDIRRLAEAPPEELTALDVSGQQADVGMQLERISRALRGDPQTGAGVDLRGADLAGRRFLRADWRRADLRGACLIRADLRGADLRLADLLGADLRGADLRAANLTEAIFLTAAQVQAAVGDAGTTLPSVLIRPPQWQP